MTRRLTALFCALSAVIDTTLTTCGRHTIHAVEIATRYPPISWAITCVEALTQWAENHPWAAWALSSAAWILIVSRL